MRRPSEPGFLAELSEAYAASTGTSIPGNAFFLMPPADDHVAREVWVPVKDTNDQLWVLFQEEPLDRAADVEGLAKKGSTEKPSSSSHPWVDRIQVAFSTGPDGVVAGRLITFLRRGALGAPFLGTGIVALLLRRLSQPGPRARRA